MLTIRLLGEVSVIRGGEALALPPSKKTRALLAYLVATGRPQSRERLCRLLWEVPDDPRGALRWSLSKLRAVVDDPGDGARILADRDTVRFVPNGVACDLHALRAAAVARPIEALPVEHLRAVAEAVNGDFLEGLDLPTQPEFQAWCVAEREEARRHHAAVLGALVARLAPDAPEEALVHSRRLVALDAFDEQERAGLVELLARTGRREEAEQHVEAGLSALREAGLPAAELSRVGRQLRAARANRGSGGAGGEVGELEAVVRPALAVTAGSDAAMAGRRIVVVDDELELGRIVAEYLERHGFSVRTAASGAALDAVLASGSADLVVLDVNLPGEDGFAIARRLRARGGPPMLFLSAAAEVVDRVVGLELGAEDYLTKPFDLRELRARIQAALRRTEVVSTGSDRTVPGLSDGVSVGGDARPSVAASEARGFRLAKNGGTGGPRTKQGQEVRFCRSADGVQIAYATSGAGPPLLKPANWMTHLEHDWESPVWRHWLRELSRNHRLIRYDERCNGLSDWHAEDLSFDACERDLEAVIEAANLQRFPMLGISQGCAFAVAYAVQHPERVSRLVLYGGYARGWAKRGDAAQADTRAAFGTLMQHGWGVDNPASRQLFTSLFVPDGTSEQAQWFNELQRVSASPENAFRLHEVFGQVQIEALLPRVRVPTLVLHCVGDSVVPFEEGRRLARGIPGARFVQLEGRNHILLEEEPAWERFLAEVRPFLEADVAPNHEKAVEPVAGELRP
ncbi:alpha/beta fold hydrolase [Sabulicella glaciei]|uniref:Alpha/beta fold hydrolase n=1 Tax=Sabulicella glaciei TaxID=2984948 RepID=A0ABT3NT25_9PROT|nr:alpha/beta fold hydrolase [Roseococcus sp. MDT2-1-1]MCW8085028.1 alpha/beta fold hydrolase [Roseococcus sp. MDT2-1-1]